MSFFPRSLAMTPRHPSILYSDFSMTSTSTTVFELSFLVQELHSMPIKYLIKGFVLAIFPSSPRILSFFSLPCNFFYQMPASQIPASKIPPELLPYLLGEKEDYSSLQDSILRISITFAVLVAVTTALRFWVRFRMLRAVGLDDGKCDFTNFQCWANSQIVLMILALLFALLLSTSCLIARHYGLGKHLWNLSPDIYKIPEHTARVTKALYV
jgi:hypothetical protein